jgi:hypothetical protein
LRVGLDSSLFNGASGSGELKFCFLFGAMQGLYKSHGAFTRDMLVMQLRAWRTSGHVTLSQDDFEYLVAPDGFIHTTYEREPLDAPAETADKSHVNSILRRFMNDRLVKHNVQQVINAGQGVVVTDL